jgi:hypothetical protein
MLSDKQNKQDQQEPKKGELTLVISEIQSTPVVGTCTSATYSFDPNEMFKKVTDPSQIMARVSPYDANRLF